MPLSKLLQGCEKSLVRAGPLLLVHALHMVMIAWNMVLTLEYGSNFCDVLKAIHTSVIKELYLNCIMIPNLEST